MLGLYLVAMSNEPEKVDKVLDTSGLACPLPLLKAKQCLNSLRVGQVLEVISTDSNAEQDFQAFVMVTPHRLLATRKVHDKLYILLEKGE